jgi:glycerol uptake facilitator-like aquaporin
MDGEGGSARTLARSLATELIGTALLLAIVVGSGISAERLAGGNVGLALLANSVATGAGLMVLILVFGPISGAHFNPVVTLVEATRGTLPRPAAAAYVAVQLAGAALGVALAHAMYDLPLLVASTHARAGAGQLVSEVVATFGLLLTILAVVRTRPKAVPFAVGLYIMAAYWFTSSSSFANPAVTLARAFTPTFTGIRPADVPAFIGAQLAGALLAAATFRWLWPSPAPAPRAALAFAPLPPG